LTPPKDSSGRDGAGWLMKTAQDLGRQLGLPATLADELAHLERHEAREPIPSLGHQLAGSAHDRGALGDRPPAPGAECVVGRRDGAVDLLAGERLELVDDLAGVGVGGRVVTRVR
jgi:hypothetical protein